jgi:hypothetical protein
MGGNIERGLGCLSMGESKHTYADAQIASLHISNQTMFSISSNIIIDSRNNVSAMWLFSSPIQKGKNDGAVRLPRPSPQPFRPYLDRTFSHCIFSSHSRLRHRTSFPRVVQSTIITIFLVSQPHTRVLVHQN